MHGELRWKWSCRCFAIAVLAALCACRGGSRNGAASDSLLASLALDTTITQTPSRDPDLAAVAGLLQKLGVARSDTLAAADTGCVLGGRTGSREGSAAAGRSGSRATEVLCEMNPGGAKLGVELQLDANGWARELRALRTQGGSVPQPIALDPTEPIDSRYPYLFTVDLDGDGIRELLLVDYRGATGNTGYHVWRYDVSSGQLVDDTALSRMTNVSRIPRMPCVMTWSTKGGVEQESSAECFANGRWTLQWESATRSDAAGRAVIREMKVRLRDTLRVVRHDSIPIAQWTREH